MKIQFLVGHGVLVFGKTRVELPTKNLSLFSPVTILIDGGKITVNGREVLDVI